MTKGKLADKILYQGLKRKNKEAFIKTYDQYLDDIYRFIFFKVNTKEEAEDLTSQVFLKTWNYIQDRDLSEYKTLKSLLYRVARNLVIDYYRQRNRQKVVSLESIDAADSLVDNKQDLHKQNEIASDMRIAHAMIRELKDEYREIIVMRYINELSIGEIAAALGKSKGNVRVIVYRALKTLREIKKTYKL